MASETWLNIHRGQLSRNSRMVIKEHVGFLESLRCYYTPRFAILGDLRYMVDFSFGEHVTIDIQGKADVLHDLTKPLPEKFQSIYNSGTLEHIWDYHAAFENVLSAINVGGTYLGHHPVAGWENHGIHVLNHAAIRQFARLNGYQIEQEFFTHGSQVCPPPRRNCGQSILYWMVARKTHDVASYGVPMDLRA